MSARKTPDDSQKRYLAKRDARIEQLYVREGEEPRDIAVKMLEEGTLTSKSEESAIRTVRGIVAIIRTRLDGARSDDSKSEVATNEVDALERKLKRLREDHAWQLAKSEDETTVTHTMVTPNGPLLIEKAKWPAGVRQKARKDAAMLAEKIADLEIALAARRAIEVERDAGVGESGGLTIIESDKSIAELIDRNLRVN